MIDCWLQSRVAVVIVGTTQACTYFLHMPHKQQQQDTKMMRANAKTPTTIPMITGRDRPVAFWALLS